MHITILTAGRRGAMAPYAALALGLRAAGFGVRLAGGARFAATARAYGLDYFGLDGVEAACMSPEALAQVQAEAWHACQQTDAIVYDPWSLLNGYYLARQQGVPAVAAALAPLSPTAAHPAWPLYSGPRLGAVYNRLTHAWAQQAAWQAVGAPVRQFWRQRAGAALGEPYAQQTAEALPVVYGYSAQVLPRPADWPDHLRVTGYWCLPPPDDWRPKPGLLDFLRTGPPVVGVRLPAAQAAVAVRALALAGLRGALLDDAEWPVGQALSSKVIRVDNGPHGWLLPRLAAVIYDGGAAMTAEVLRAGLPSLIVPSSGGESTWGWLLAERGLGVVTRGSTSASHLAGTLYDVLADLDLRDRLAALSAALAAEEGTRQAVEVIAEAVR